MRKYHAQAEPVIALAPITGGRLSRSALTCSFRTRTNEALGVPPMPALAVDPDSAPVYGVTRRGQNVSRPLSSKRSPIYGKLCD